MYGYYHPLYARHLMHEHAYEREALRQLVKPEPVDEVPPSAGTVLTRWLAVFGTLVIGLTVVSALLAVDPPAADQSSKSTHTCTVGGPKVASFAPCPPVI